MEPSTREEEDRLVLRMGQLGYCLLPISFHSSLIAFHYLSYRFPLDSPTRLFIRSSFPNPCSTSHIRFSLFIHITLFWDCTTTISPSTTRHPSYRLIVMTPIPNPTHGHSPELDSTHSHVLFPILRNGNHLHSPTGLKF